MPFTSLDAVKRALRIPLAVTDGDGLLNEIIDEVHGTILADIGGGLTSALLTQYVQEFDIVQEGYRGIRLPKWPVGEVTEVRTGTNLGGTGEVVDTDRYYVTEEGTLRLEGGSASWPVGKQNVRVTWTAGFATTTTKDYLSLALAEKMTVCEAFKGIPASGLKGERIGNYSYTRQSASERGSDVYPGVASRIVARYRSVFAYDPVVP